MFKKIIKDQNKKYYLRLYKNILNFYYLDAFSEHVPRSLDDNFPYQVKKARTL